MLGDSHNGNPIAYELALTLLNDGNDDFGVDVTASGDYYDAMDSDAVPVDLSADNADIVADADRPGWYSIDDTAMADHHGRRSADGRAGRAVDRVFRIEQRRWMWMSIRCS